MTYCKLRPALLGKYSTANAAFTKISISESCLYGAAEKDSAKLFNPNAEFL